MTPSLMEMAERYEMTVEERRAVELAAERCLAARQGWDMLTHETGDDVLSDAGIEGRRWAQMAAVAIELANRWTDEGRVAPDPPERVHESQKDVVKTEDDPDELVAGLRKLALELGRTPTGPEIDASELCAPLSAYRRCFSNIRHAVIRAGLDPVHTGKRVPLPEGFREKWSAA